MATDPNESPLANPIATAITIKGLKDPKKGITRKANPGSIVLGTVAHFLPTLSTIKPAGMIIINEPKVIRKNRNPIRLADIPISSAYRGNIL